MSKGLKSKGFKAAERYVSNVKIMEHARLQETFELVAAARAMWIVLDGARDTTIAMRDAKHRLLGALKPFDDMEV